MPQMQIGRAIGIQKLPCDAVEAVGVGVMLVIAGFVLHKEQNHDTTRHANRQAKDVNERKNFIAPNGAESGCEVVGEHDGIALWLELFFT